MPSLIIYEGSTYRDENADMEFEVLAAPTPGAMECAQVWVEYEDGQVLSHPYDYFAGHDPAFELVMKGDDYPSGDTDRHPLT